MALAAHVLYGEFTGSLRQLCPAIDCAGEGRYQDQIDNSSHSMFLALLKQIGSPGVPSLLDR
jgi:hypothetical protein